MALSRRRILPPSRALPGRVSASCSSQALSITGGTDTLIFSGGTICRPDAPAYTGLPERPPTFFAGRRPRLISVRMAPIVRPSIVRHDAFGSCLRAIDGVGINQRCGRPRSNRPQAAIRGGLPRLGSTYCPAIFKGSDAFLRTIPVATLAIMVPGHAELSKFFGCTPVSKVHPVGC